MKKIIAFMLIVATCITCAFAFTACDKKDKSVAKVIDIELTQEEYAYCVNKSDSNLLTSVNTYIDTIKANGTFETILNKYFGDGEPALISAKTESVNRANELVVVTNAAFEPFEYTQGSYFSGIDMEIAQGLATYLGKELVIRNIPFTSIFSEVEAGNADIGMAGITKNETREKMVQFSKSYYNAAQVLVVKADCTVFDNCTTKEDVVAIFDTFTKDTIVGYQNGTTGSFYVEGDEGWGFDGLKSTGKGYDNASLAIQAMINGNVNYVIVDKAPAEKITEKMNKIA